MIPAQGAGSWTGDPRPLSSAQTPIWRAEMLHRGTPRWTQLTAARLHGPIDADRLEGAVNAVAARHPALGTQILLRQRQAWQAFAKPGHVPLHRHGQPTPPEGQAGAVAAFLAQAAHLRFPVHGAPLFRADLLALGPESFLLMLRLHHIAADGVALALIVSEAAARYRGEGGAPAPDRSYERWLDSAVQQASAPAVADAAAFYGRELAGVPASHAALYDQPEGGTPHDPPHLPEATCTLAAGTCEALRRLARAEGATLFILLFAAYAATLRAATGASDLLVATFVSGRAGQPEPLVGSCINTLLVRLRLGGDGTARGLVAAVQAGWRPVRQHQGAPLSLVSKAAGSLPVAQFAINYLDMKEAAFTVPGVTAQVTHAQQGYPLNDLLLYALREQDGRLRLRLIVGSGTPRISQGRVEAMLGELERLLHAWAAPSVQDSSPRP